MFALPACSGEEPQHRVVILGVDGMDYRLTREMMDAGKLPNLAALAAEGGFEALGTSIPPESPVAWSNFITGRNPGGHGIFDFLHREWQTDDSTGETHFIPVDSIAGAEDLGMTLSLFGYEIPLSGGEAINKRKGTAFWEVLENHGVPATVFKIPANYPPTPTNQKTLSGMGTPDVQGGYGTYYLYTDDSLAVSDNVESGKVITVSIYNNSFSDFLIGPENSLKQVPDTTSVPFRVDIDPEEPVVRITIGEGDDAHHIVLKEGEWSDYFEVNFDMIPMVVGISGVSRLYLQEVRPTFRLFVDPINLNPLEPALDVSTPPDWVTEVAEMSGTFETKGMPENTKALEEGVLDDDEFREYSIQIYERRKKMLLDLLAQHESGLFFYYFSSIDLNCHMLWRCIDPEHPNRPDRVSEESRKFIEWLYEDVDRTIGEVRKQLREDDTLIVMSDHGFAPYYRSFHLNTWLKDHGYLVLEEGVEQEDVQGLVGVDWSKTRAYNLGFTGIYLNVKGRDPMGIVDPSDADALVDEINSALMQEVDPENGEALFLENYRREDVYSGDSTELAPEIIVGFRRKYRNSNESAMGAIPTEVISDNLGAWSGCHLMAADEVPGVLFTNRKIGAEHPKLYDLTVTILSEYDIDKLPDQVGQPLWSSSQGP